MLKLSKFCAVSVLSLMLSTTAFAAGEDMKLTLADAVSKGIHTNPQYGVIANNKKATEQELGQAKALWMPSVDFVGEGGWERADNLTTGDKQNLLRSRGSLSLTQLLFDGWGTQNQIKRQEYRVESVTNRTNEVVEFVGLDVVQAYLEVLRQRDLLTIARANSDAHIHIFDTISAGANAGTATEGDSAQASARLNNARANVSSVEQDLRSAEALFIQKVGEMPGDMSFPEVPRDSLSPTVDDAVRDAVVNSPTLAVFESDIKVSSAEYASSFSTMYPKVDLEVNGVTGNNLSGVEGNQNSASALAVMKWNLFRGGADRDRQHEFMYRHAESKERRAQAARQVEKDMRDTWAAMNAAAIREKEFADQATSNEKVVNVYLDQFSLDRRTLLDVLDAQNELFVSRSNRVNAMYSEMFAVFRVLALKGAMLKSLGVQMPAETKLAK